MITYGKAEPQKIKVWYSGTDTLKEGYALCYDYNSQTDGFNLDTDAVIDDSTVALGRRRVVEKPAVANCAYFAGVVAPEFEGFVGPGEIAIIPPGNACNIWAAGDADMETNDKKTLTFSVDQYYFKYAGWPGEGTALVLQDVDRSSTAGLVQAYLMTGEPSCGVEAVTPVAGAITSINEEVGATILVAATIDSNATQTLTGGQYIGQRKLIRGATMTTSDVVLTLTITGGTTLTIDAATEQMCAIWGNGIWMDMGSSVIS